MKSITILLALLYFYAVPMDIAICQSGNFTDFLPLQVGNVWVYQCSVSCFGSNCYGGACIRRVRVIITNTNIMNGRTYYQSQSTVVLISGSCNDGCGAFPFGSNIRVDSSTANLLSYTTSGCQHLLNETLEDSFKARRNDTIRYHCQSPGQYFDFYVCMDTNNVTIFGSSRPARIYGYSGFESGWSRSYVKGIGLNGTSFSHVCGNGACYISSSLRGCVVNGVLYGDTSMLVGIKQISTEVPDNFVLYQNYPNPFNPVTKIKFDVPVETIHELSLRVYDFLGREITTLVNEKLKPGTYEVEWDAINYPSGVYFYKLTSGDFSETKRLVLLK
jgi:hypothetical protein